MWRLTLESDSDFPSSAGETPAVPGLASAGGSARCLGSPRNFLPASCVQVIKGGCNEQESGRKSEGGPEGKGSDDDEHGSAADRGGTAAQHRGIDAGVDPGRMAE